MTDNPKCAHCGAEVEFGKQHVCDPNGKPPAMELPSHIFDDE